MKTAQISWGVLTLVSALSGVSQAADKRLIDYFLPRPIVGEPTSTRD
jgi:hypothetical protein